MGSSVGTHRVGACDRTHTYRPAADQRARPTGLWPGLRSILVLAMSYRPEHDPLALVAQPERGAIAAYAQRRDYQDRKSTR